MTKQKYVVIVDDDSTVREVIAEYLTKKGYEVKAFTDDEGLFSSLTKRIPDLIILDIVLPGMDGFAICNKLKSKEKFSDIPVIILSGQDGEISKVSGLEMGADDYVVKPFSLNELAARIKAILRRGARHGEENVLEVGELIEIDFTKHTVTVEGKRVELTPAEFQILELLASREGQVFSRDRMLEYLWGEEKIVIERTIDVHIRHLREKLGKAGDLIKNVRGVGYKLDMEP